MALMRIMGVQRFTGLSTDDKPTEIPFGFVGVFLETDTETYHVWNGLAWVSSPGDPWE